MEQTIVPDSNKPDYKVTAADMQRYRIPQSMRIFMLGLSILLILVMATMFLQGRKITALENKILRLENKVQNLENSLDSLVEQKKK